MYRIQQFILMYGISLAGWQFPLTLCVCQVILPHISFTGHLSGILVGLLHVYGLTKSLLPSPGMLLHAPRPPRHQS